jgi:hypothetical protein
MFVLTCFPRRFTIHSHHLLGAKAQKKVEEEGFLPSFEDCYERASERFAEEDGDADNLSNKYSLTKPYPYRFNDGGGECVYELGKKAKRQESKYYNKDSEEGKYVHLLCLCPWFTTCIY